LKMIIEKITGLARRRNREKDQNRSYFYVSEVNKCPREIYYAFKKMPRAEPDAAVIRKLEHGDYVHMKIIGSLMTLGVVSAIEVPIPEGKLFHGRADAVINLDGAPYLVEIKSVNHSRFQRLTAPEPGHYKQLQLYLHYLNLEHGILILEDKDTQELKEFIVEKDPGILREIFITFRKLRSQIARSIVPPRPCFSEDEQWRCRCCAYQEVCHA